MGYCLRGHQGHRDLAPRNITTGANVWVYDVRLSNTTAGRPPENYNVDATSYAEMRAGCYLIEERVRAMSANGVLASMMRVSVDEERCTEHGRSYMLAPRVVAPDVNGCGQAVYAEVPPEQEADARKAATCPERAILV